MLLCTAVVYSSSLIFVWLYIVILCENKVILSSFLGHINGPSYEIHKS